MYSSWDAPEDSPTPGVCVPAAKGGQGRACLTIPPKKNVRSLIKQVACHPIG
jgi:hypothetical protein